MSNFIKPKESNFGYRGNVLENKPVNLDLCTSLSRSVLRWYPDNQGKPSIKFDGCDTEWYFHDEEERDRVFNEIAGNCYEQRNIHEHKDLLEGEE